MFPVFTRCRDAFSHVQPPCMAVLTITAGNVCFTRGSIAASNIDTGAAAARPGDRSALGVDLGETQQEIERPDGVPIWRPADTL